MVGREQGVNDDTKIFKVLYLASVYFTLLNIGLLNFRIILATKVLSFFSMQVICGSCF